MTPIFITSWNRRAFTTRVIYEILSRTEPGTFEIHVFDNGSDWDTREYLLESFREGVIKSLHLDSRNTRCLYNKLVFCSMVPSDQEYFVITDNDFIPAVNWLPRMLDIMEASPELAMLTPAYWPTWPMNPLKDRGTYIETEAVGNTFKLCRTSVLKEIAANIPQDINAFGDDGIFSARAREMMGFRVGMCKNVFTYNLELTEPNWGYTEEELNQDPRKAGYTPPERYVPLDWDTLEVPHELRLY